MLQALAVCALLVVFSASASADPVSLGVWSPAPEPDGDFFPFYDGASFDCHRCGVAFVLPPDVEFLNDGLGGLIGFAFERFPGASLAMQVTAWRSGSLWWDPDTGAFIYDTGTGFRHDSRDGLAMALFRDRRDRLTEYWLAVEDLPVGWPAPDRDFNDAVYYWAVAMDPGTDPPAPTPEPGTLVLVATCALAGMSRRRSRLAARRRNTP